jgi:hypothetical protein
MYLGTYFSKTSIIIPEALSSLLLESFLVCMHDGMCNDACKIFAESFLHVLPTSNWPRVLVVEPLEGHGF